jgi:eukaryotic-like serine/threonine-protein kinase
MGEVYRARDSRLGRQVAIKVLRSDRTGDEARRRRFVQEARTASALNHPHIATIYDLSSADGIDFIVMEYVDGRPLSALVRGGMRMDEVLRVAIAVADALSHAHAAGIVHRDIKPANVAVAADGAVKVLDFGLARLVETPTAVAPHDDTATESVATTTAASVLAGTPGYVSPEQVAGGPVDARSDIFSFGSMLYEMVTGRRAFQGASPIETLTQVMRDQPTPPSELAPDVPAHLERLILRCLRKEPGRRWQHMADVRLELQEIRDAPEGTGGAARSRGMARLTPWLVGAGALALAATWWWASARDDVGPAPRLLPLTAMRGVEASPSFSPDGSQVAYAWEGDLRSQAGPTTFDIWLRLVGRSEARRLTTHPADDVGPAWSPDGTTIAFCRGRLGGPSTIYLVSPLGGAERKLSDFRVAKSDTTWFRGAAVPQLSWSPDGRWLAAVRERAPDETTGESGGIHLIPVQGGAPRPITAPTLPAVHRDPAFSPDGRSLAYAACANDKYAACDVYVLDVDATLTPRPPARRLTHQDLSILGIAWTRDGRSIVYGGARLDFAHLWRVAVDGRSAPERIESSRRGLTPAIAAQGNRLAFGQHLNETDIYLFEEGRPSVPLISSSALDHGPTYSPDGRRIAFESGRSGEVEEIWLANADGSNPVQLTHGPGGWQGSPSWSPDGKRIAFDSRGRDGFFDVWTIEPDGSGLRRVTPGPLNDNLPTWSRDGRWIYYESERSDGNDIWRVPASGGTPEQITRGGGFRATESPDGRTLFFVRQDDASPLFSQPAEGGPARQVVDCVLSRSMTTGPDGIYYVGCPPERAEMPLYRLDVKTSATRLLGILKAGGGFIPGMSVSPDGKRVLYTPLVAEGSDLMLMEDFR